MLSSWVVHSPLTSIPGNNSTNTTSNTGFGAGSSLFGNTNNAAKPSLFGASTTQNTTSSGLFGQSQQQPQQLGQSQFSQQTQQQQQLAPWQSGLEPTLQLDPALMVDVPGDMLFEDIEKKHPQLASWILNVE
jgi:hypothetical protein